MRGRAQLEGIRYVKIVNMYEVLQLTQKNHILVTNSLCQVWQQKNSGPVMKKLRSVDEKNSGQAQKNSGLMKKKLRFSEII